MGVLASQNHLIYRFCEIRTAFDQSTRCLVPEKLLSIDAYVLYESGLGVVKVTYDARIVHMVKVTIEHPSLSSLCSIHSIHYVHHSVQNRLINKVKTLT